MKLHSLNLGAAALTALIGTGFVSPAPAMTVQPVILDLEPTGQAMSQVVTVENTFAAPLPVEMRIEALKSDETGLHGTGQDPGDLLVFPQQALIAPGQTQAFRVQYLGNSDLATSKHYYVTAAQLPVKLAKDQSKIQILYNFQILVSIALPGVKPKLSVAKAEIGTNQDGKPVPILTISNSAATYGYLSAGRLRIVETDAAGREIFRKLVSGPELEQSIGLGLVTAGQSRRILIPVVLPSEGGHIEAQFTGETRH